VISTQWYGKAATVTMFLCVTLLILFPEMPIILANILILVCLLAVINACILYGYYYIYIISQGKNDQPKRDESK
jgi:phosphatidylglycerophosphate synthase